LRCPRRLAGLAHISMSRGAQSHTLNAAELSTGALLVVSAARSAATAIDNATRPIRDNGWVDCKDPFAKSTGTSTTTGSRLDLIRQSLRGN
jgi:hypothetical protein